MLSAAPLLEELTLIFYANHGKRSHLPITSYIPLHFVRGSNDLQHLKKICLGDFKTPQDQLVRLLLVIAGTVTYIHMDGIVLNHESWLKGGFQGLYNAGLGEEEEMDLEELGISVNVCDISFCIVHCEGDHLLRWLRDGIRSYPASSPAPR